MKRAANVIAVDLGASGGRVFHGAFSPAGLRLQEVHRFEHEAASLYFPGRSGATEEHLVWDETFIYSQILAGLRMYRRQVAPKADAIGIDAWGTDGLFTSADGTPLDRMYSYRDHRLDGMSEAVRARVGGDRIYRITGIDFQPYNVANQVLWFARNRAGLIRRGIRFMPTPTLFAYYLGGVTSIDSTWASVTQLMDCRRGTWSRPILHDLGMPAGVMPAIVRPGTVVGRMHVDLARAIGMPPARIVAVAAHDTASAFAAAPARDPSSALIISSGTWSLVGKIVPAPITTAEAMAAGLSNEGGVDSIRLLKNCMGTWIAQELRRIWRDRDGRESTWQELTELARKAAPSNTFVDPDDRLFYSPRNMEDALLQFGRRTRQRMPTDRGAILRMVYECLALKYRFASEQISAVSGLRTDVVHIVGGGSRNEFLNQVTADVFGKPVVAGPEDATAIGNALLQATGLGILKSASDGRSLVRSGFPIREYLPASAGQWEKSYTQFVSVLGRAAARA